MLPSCFGVQVIGRQREIEIRVGERADQAEQRRKSHPVDGQQSRIPQMCLSVARGSGARASARTKFFALGQRVLHHDRARQIDDADDEERISPVEMMGDHARDVTAAESAQHGT